MGSRRPPKLKETEKKTSSSKALASAPVPRPTGVVFREPLIDVPVTDPEVGASKDLGNRPTEGTLPPSLKRSKLDGAPLIYSSFSTSERV